MLDRTLQSIKQTCPNYEQPHSKEKLLQGIGGVIDGFNFSEEVANNLRVQLSAVGCDNCLGMVGYAIGTDGEEIKTAVALPLNCPNNHKISAVTYRFFNYVYWSTIGSWRNK